MHVKGVACLNQKRCLVLQQIHTPTMNELQIT